VYQEAWNFPHETEEVDAMKEAIRGIRDVRTQMQVSPKQKTTVIFVSDDAHTQDIFREGASFLAPLAFASEVRVQADMTDVESTAVSIPLHKMTAFIPLEQLIDLDKERERLGKEKKRLEDEIGRLEKKLSNPGFTGKAPAAVVEGERTKQTRYKEQLRQVEEQLARLS
jgi:valyl-tRNA synthetase